MNHRIAPKRERITTKLFKTYAWLFLLFFSIGIAAVVLFISLDINQSIITTQEQMIDTINQTMDQYFSSINDFSMELLNSAEFKKATIVDLPHERATGQGQVVSLRIVYQEAYKMFEKGYRVGVATKSGYYIYLGEQILVEPLLHSVDTYADYSGAGRAVVSRQEENAFLDAIDQSNLSIYKSRASITLARSINQFNFISNPQAMLEVHVDADTFDAFAKSLADNSNLDSLQMQIVNGQGDTLYGKEEFDIQPFKKAGQLQTASYRYDGNIVRVCSLFNGDVFAVYSIPIAVYYNKLITFLVYALLLFIVLSSTTLLVTYRVSRSLSSPIRELGEQLEKLDLSKDIHFEKVDTSIYELDLLAQTVSSISDKLNASLEDIVTLKTIEMQARLLALQSQVQPHFLYNTLAAIGMLAENGESATVSRMCTNLSKILRYVTHPSDGSVTLYEEVEFLNCYTEIMLERFPHALVKIDIPIEMMQIQIPKLILQLLVENAFKYSDRVDTTISLTGVLSGESWRVIVQDNGKGFTKQDAEDIMSRCRYYAENHNELTLHMDGMGLVNIFLRLNHYYKSEFIFVIETSTAGASITVGGGLI